MFVVVIAVVVVVVAVVIVVLLIGYIVYYENNAAIVIVAKILSLFCNFNLSIARSQLYVCIWIPLCSCAYHMYACVSVCGMYIEQVLPFRSPFVDLNNFHV